MSLRRRDFLRALGLGGAGAALLGPLLTRFAGADGARPCRFVFGVEGNCYEPVTVLADAARAGAAGVADDLKRFLAE